MFQIASGFFPKGETEAKEVMAILVFNMVEYCAAKVVILWKKWAVALRTLRKTLRTLRLNSLHRDSRRKKEIRRELET